MLTAFTGRVKRDTAAMSGSRTPRQTGIYREIHHSPFEYKGTLRLDSMTPEVTKPSTFVLQLTHDQSALDDMELHGADLADLPALPKREVI